MAKSKIIKDLANGSVDIVTALKRAKVLISDLDCPEMLNWLNNEISGYPKDAELPSYRISRGNLKGSYFKGSMASHMTYTNVSLPLGKMPEDMQEDILALRFRDSVSALKELVTSAQKSNGKLGKAIPADVFPNIALYNDDPYMIITSANVVLDHSA